MIPSSISYIRGLLAIHFLYFDYLGILKFFLIIEGWFFWIKNSGLTIFCFLYFVCVLDANGFGYELRSLSYVEFLVHDESLFSCCFLDPFFASNFWLFDYSVSGCGSFCVYTYSCLLCGSRCSFFK